MPRFCANFITNIDSKREIKLKRPTDALVAEHSRPHSSLGPGIPEPSGGIFRRQKSQVTVFRVVTAW